MQRFTNFRPLALLRLRPCRDARSTHRSYALVRHPGCAKPSPCVMRLSTTTAPVILAVARMLSSCGRAQDKSNCRPKVPARFGLRPRLRVPSDLAYASGLRQNRRLTMRKVSSGRSGQRTSFPRDYSPQAHAASLLALFDNGGDELAIRLFDRIDLDRVLVSRGRAFISCEHLVRHVADSCVMENPPVRNGSSRAAMRQSMVLVARRDARSAPTEAVVQPDRRHVHLM